MDILDAVMSKYYASGTGYVAVTHLESQETYGQLLDKLQELDKNLFNELDSNIGQLTADMQDIAYKQGFKDCFKLFMDMQKAI